MERYYITEVLRLVDERNTYNRREIPHTYKMVRIHVDFVC
jgi:hypothetical protein